MSDASILPLLQWMVHASTLQSALSLVTITPLWLTVLGEGDFSVTVLSGKLQTDWNLTSPPVSLATLCTLHRTLIVKVLIYYAYLARPPKRMHDTHYPRAVPPKAAVIHNCQIGCLVKGIKIILSPVLEIIKELMRRAKREMLVFTLGKQCRIPFNPQISCLDPAGRTKPGFTRMGNYFFILTVWALVHMVSCRLCPAGDHFFNIPCDT